MRKSINLVAAATLTMAGFSFNVSRADDAATNTPANSGATSGSAMDRIGDSSTTRPSGASVSDLDAHEIRSTLGSVTNVALTRDGFSMLGVYLVPSVASADANSVAPAPQPKYPEGAKPNQPLGGYTATVQIFKNYDDLNNAVDQLQKDWKEKYSSDFKLTSTNESAVYNDSFQLVRNDISQSARQASERMSPANSSGSSDSNTIARKSTDADARNSNSNNNAATVFIAPVENAPAVTIDLVRPHSAVGNWKIQEPTSASEQTIHDNLLKQLNTLHDQKANWPADQDAAYRAVSRQILSVFSDSNANGGSGNNIDRSHDNRDSSENRSAGSGMPGSGSNNSDGNAMPK
jgi:hypothetical protein